MERANKIGNDIYGVRGISGRPAHRRAYERYFRGYTEVRVARPKGGWRIERIYTANWHVRALSPAAVRLAKLRYLLLCALGCGGYCWLMCLPGLDGNRSPWAGVGQIAAVVCMILLAAALAGYLLSGPRMTWWERHAGSDRLRRFALAAGIAFGITGLLIALNILLGVSSAPRELLLAAGAGLCALPLFTVARLEGKMPYAEEKNDAVLPEGDRFEIV